ncbi:hypothetical protein PHYSODRAFT_306530 [Phytophthora sojae]|uniref:Uncharacterized protein n=1 Tax=Phytophthora sojae (strain P6497) TaxID=1094619 RepID=G5A9N9_PHYSP|nr:hypothetical protein PHYSODRAFT_306530 [Phytophthora sojae]EGZ07319.1 hypothetical protein PHYSODRAFT_306530 [Phytophthora sojae]|eukprot:XP_009536885.1 hypothetical protein PHYSODRAFT_306530 [Phytophthora sojae]
MPDLRFNTSNGPDDEPTKLLLYVEFPVMPPMLNPVGLAVWLVHRGDRMLAVIEAKPCGIRRVPLLAMMEALLESHYSVVQDAGHLHRLPELVVCGAILQKKCKDTAPSAERFEDTLLEI